jgi:hypothetical protein
MVVYHQLVLQKEGFPVSQIFKLLSAIIETMVILSLMRSTIPAEHVDGFVKFGRMFYRVLTLLLIPVALLRLMFKERDDREAIFVFETLQRALSYSEWKHFDDIWDAVKDNLPPSMQAKSEENAQIDLLQTLLLLSAMDLMEGRIENEEEYIKKMLKGGSKIVFKEVAQVSELTREEEHDPEKLAAFKKKCAQMHWNLSRGYSHHAQLANGLEHVFLRKPIGNWRKGKRLGKYVIPAQT